MSLDRVITDDEADYDILGLANEKGKFAISVGGTPRAEQQYAIERCLENEWMRLIDVSTVANGPPLVIFRIFMLTTTGKQRRDTLAATFDPPPQTGV